MVKYHIATGDGKAYYGVNYESYRETEAVLRFSQKHDPQAHIVEEEYHFTNADRIRAMSDEELAAWLVKKTKYQESAWSQPSYLNFLTESNDTMESAIKGTVEWIKQPAEGERQ